MVPTNRRPTSCGASVLSPSFREVLRDAVRSLETARIAYVVMGGVGSAARGRPRGTHDIDIFVTPQSRHDALVALDNDGFRTEETFPHWLFKAFKQDVMVDLIFRSAGEIYLDDEMLAHASVEVIEGHPVQVMAPEDLLVIKAIVADEHLPHHWYDALSLLARDDLDWDYLGRRARAHGLRRVSSLLLYAESNDVWIPPGWLGDLLQLLHPGPGAAL